MKRQIAIFLTCIFTAAICYLITPNKQLASDYPVNIEKLIPLAIPGWSELNDAQVQIVASPELEKKVNSIYSQVVSRRYVSADGHIIMLSVAYTKDQRDNSGQQSHKPEICYPAQGFEILNRNKVVLSGSKTPVVQLETVNQDRFEDVTYFITIGNVVVDGNIQTKIAQMKYGLRGYIPDGLIFRVSSVDRDTARAFKLQEQFIYELFKNLPAGAERIFPVNNEKS